MLPEQGASMGTPTDFAMSNSEVLTDDSAQTRRPSASLNVTLIIPESAI
jgi:hypothetical protein